MGELVIVGIDQGQWHGLVASILAGSALIPVSWAKEGCDPPFQPVWPRAQQDEGSFLHNIEVGPEGYLWLGSIDGLFRHEGGRVRSWPLADGGRRAGSVHAFLSDERSLWVGTATGLYQINADTGDTSLVPIGVDDTLGAEVHAIIRHHDVIYVGHAYGITKLDASDGSHLDMRRIDDLRFRPTNLEVVGEHLFIETEGGLISIGINTDPEDKIPEPALVRAPVDAGVDGAVTALVGRGPDLYVFGSSNYVLDTLHGGITKFDGDELPLIEPRAFYDATVDQRGFIWLGGQAGLQRLDPVTRTIMTCDLAPSGDSAPRLSIQAVIVRDERLLTASTVDGTLIADLARQGVERVGSEILYPDEKPRGVWSAAIDDDGILVLATTEGVFREQGVGSRRFSPVAPDQLGELPAYGLASGVDGDVWIATRGGLFVEGGGRVEAVPLRRPDGSGSPPNIIYSLASADGRLFVGTSRGAFVVDMATRAVSHFVPAAFGLRPGGPVTVDTTSDRVWHVMVTEDGEGYATNDSVVVRASLADGRVLATSEPGFAAAGIAPGKLYASTVLGDRVYLATGSGLYEADRNLEDIARMPVPDALDLRSVTSIAADASGALWLGSSGPLIRFDPDANAWRATERADGGTGRGMIQGALSAWDGGIVLAGDAAGLSIVRSGDLGLPPMARPTLASVRTSERSLDPTLPLRLSSRERDLAVEFGATGGPQRPYTSLSYRLTSPDGSSTRRTTPVGDPLYLAGLSPGRYRLTAILTDETGRRSPPLRTTIAVAPTFTQSVAFKAMWLIAALGAVVWFVSARSRTAFRETSLLARERVRIASNIHDGFVQEVAAAALVGHLAAEKVENPVVRDDLSKAFGLLENATASARASVHDLSALGDARTFDEELAHYVSVAEAFGLTATIDRRGRPWPMRPGPRVLAARVVGEAILNTAKHSGVKQATVSVRWTRFGLAVAVEDEGRGFLPSDARSEGFGLADMTRTARTLHARFRYRSRPGIGTTVTLRLRRVWVGAWR